MSNIRRHIRDERGFNLIELMIVIAIIGILIGVGTWGWGAMTRSANENAAVQTLRRISTIQGTYAAQNKSRFGNFQQLVSKGLLDAEYSSDRPIANGYIFTITVEEPTDAKPSSYSVTAEPQVPTGVSATGNRYFYTDSNLGSIRSNDTGPANADSPSI